MIDSYVYFVKYLITIFIYLVNKFVCMLLGMLLYV